MTQRTADKLVVEESPGTEILIGSFFAGIGAIFALIGWTKGPTLFLIVGPVFVLFGLKFLIFARTITHRFERWRSMVTIDSKGRWGSARRELPLDSIADIILEEIRTRGTSYYIYYVTKQGERIIWADSYDGSRENTVECFNVAREFLGFAPAPVDGEPKRG